MRQSGIFGGVMATIVLGFSHRLEGTKSAFLTLDHG